MVVSRVKVGRRKEDGDFWSHRWIAMVIGSCLLQARCREFRERGGVSVWFLGGERGAEKMWVLNCIQKCALVEIWREQCKGG